MLLDFILPRLFESPRMAYNVALFFLLDNSNTNSESNDRRSIDRDDRTTLHIVGSTQEQGKFGRYRLLELCLQTVLSMDPAYSFTSWDADDSLLEAWIEAGASLRDSALSMQFGARSTNEEANAW